MPGTRKLGRPSDHRKAMLRGMVTFLLENGKIETTVTRAKEVRAEAEKMITLGKVNTLHTKRQVLAYVTKEDVAKKVFDEIAPKYADKNGGYTRKLGRPSDHRKAMLRGMVTFLLENGKIETTVTRAKEVRAEAEKMITLGKVNTLHTKRQVLAYVTKEDVAKKVFDEIAPKYADKNGGYTRIYKIGPRRGDAAEMAIIELV